MGYKTDYFYPDPQDLYDPDPLMRVSFFRIYGDYIFGPITGIAGMAAFNFLKRRPLISGLQYYALSAAASLTGWTLLHRMSTAYFTKRDQIHKHYVKLHPEDFPPLEKKKIGDVFENWSPQR